jgi:hypothetical protein
MMASGASGAVACKVDGDTDRRQAAWLMVSQLGYKPGLITGSGYICSAAIECGSIACSERIGNS